MIFKKYTAYQKLYYYKLNKSIDDFIFNVKEKYSKINWKNLQNINQSFFDLSDTIKWKDKEMTLKEALGEISLCKAKLKEAQKKKYYTEIIKTFLESTKNKDIISIKNIYSRYDEKLDEKFKEISDIFSFILFLLKEINKSIKARKK